MPPRNLKKSADRGSPGQVSRSAASVLLFEDLHPYYTNILCYETVRRIRVSGACFARSWGMA